MAVATTKTATGTPAPADTAAAVGVSDHAGWAVLVTVAGGGRFLDRRRVVLVEAGLPVMPHHHDAQALTLPAATALIARVRASAERQAAIVLDAVAATVAAPIGVLALRACPALPPTLAERLSDYRSKNVADWVMYRMALAGAAEARGWRLHWYHARRVLDEACAVVRADSLDSRFAAVRTAIGPPWNADHKLAMAAAIVAAGTTR